MHRRERRFLLLMREYVLGGAETQFRYFIEYAEKQKWKLDVLIEHDLNKNDDILKKAKTEMTSVRFYELNGGRESGELFLSIMLHIIKNIGDIKYTACLIYHPEDLVIAPLMSILGIRTVYSERQDASVIENNLYFQKYLRSCRYILANSNNAKEKLEKVTGRKVGLIRNGKPAVLQFPVKRTDKIRRIFVPSRIEPTRNLMLLLYYLKEYPNFDGKMVFAGLIENKAYWNKINQFVCRHHLQDRVEFLGFLENMEEEYEKADLVIRPSLVEGTPNVVLESYAYGRPIIVSDIRAERDVVKNPKLRFGIKNPEEIDACIKYIEGLSDESYRQMIDKNRRMVLQNYSIEKMAESFYAVLSKC